MFDGNNDFDEKLKNKSHFSKIEKLKNRKIEKNLNYLFHFSW